MPTRRGWNAAGVKRIGIFGGTFDPVHMGHLMVAQAAMEELGLDRIFFIPAAQSPFKPGQEPAPAALRVRMLRLALAAQSRYEVDVREVERGGISYTVDTARHYADRYPDAERYYLIGADHVELLPSWREADELAGLVRFGVVARPGEAVADAPAPFEVRVLRGHPVGISSSQIRSRVRAGRPIALFTGDAVADVIQNYRLYL